jgi:hypothetical protein
MSLYDNGPFRALIFLLACTLPACSGGGSGTPGTIALATSAIVPNVTGVTSLKNTASPKPSPAASPKPKPSSVAYDGPPDPNVRDHTLSVDYNGDTIAQVNSTFGMSNWSIASHYIDLVMNPWGTSYDAAVRAGGIPTGGYIDPNLCSGSYSVGAGQYPAPDCATLTNDAFYSQPGNPANALTVSYNGTVVQKYGNPSSATLQSAALAAVQNNIAADGPFTLEEIDDAMTPDEYYNPTRCWGIGTPTGSGYSCATAPGGTASAPWGSNYSAQSWAQGEAQLAQEMPVPVVLNGLASWAPGETQAAITSTTASGANVWGGECDACFYGTGGSGLGKWTGALFDANLTSVMAVISAGRNVIVINEEMTDTHVRARALADIMLVYNPNHLYIANVPCGTISHIRACAEQGLTFHRPLNGYPSSPSSLRTSSGLYVREFGACYNLGTLIGPCASVVNPDSGASHPLAGLANTYTHTLVISGTGPCNCYGDSGSVALNGPAVPASLPPGTGYVALP